MTVRNLDNVGDAIDNSLAAGATTFDGVSFRVDDPAKAEAQARAAAMAQAKAKADDPRQGRRRVASAASASISETAAPVPYPIAYDSRGRRSRPPTRAAADARSRPARTR